MNYELTSNFLRWRLFQKPERVQVLLCLLLVSTDAGYIDAPVSRISEMTGLSIVTTQCSIKELEGAHVIEKRDNQWVIANLPNGIRSSSQRAQRCCHRQKKAGDTSPSASIISDFSTNPLSSALRFQRPTLEQVVAYVSEKGYSFSPDHFFSFYESNGWKVGRNPMKDWHAACRTWQYGKRNERSKAALTDVSQETYQQSW